jgi:hypothetical protein
MTHASAFDGMFQGKDRQEAFQFYFRQHWIRLLWPFVRTALLTIVVLAGAVLALSLAGIEDTASRVLTAAFFTVCLLLVQFWFLARVYRYFLSVVVITDKRAHRIRKTILAYDEHESIDLWVLQDIRKLQRGPIQNTLGFGTLLLESSDIQMRIHFVPHVAQRYQDLMQLVERARGERHMRQEAATAPLPMSA